MKEKSAGRIVKESYFKKFEKEKTYQPQKKHMKLVRDVNSKEIDSNVSNVEDIIKVTSNNDNESEFQVSILW